MAGGRVEGKGGEGGREGGEEGGERGGGSQWFLRGCRIGCDLHGGSIYAYGPLYPSPPPLSPTTRAPKGRNEGERKRGLEGGGGEGSYLLLSIWDLWRKKGSGEESRMREGGEGGRKRRKNGRERQRGRKRGPLHE